jgi:alpha-beta hydrolase superfamily lysophospholipase
VPPAKSSSRRKRWVVRSIVLVGLLAGVWLGFCTFAANSLTHRARPAYDEPPPALAWGQIEPERLRTSDGLGIGAWFVDAPGAGPSVLLLHGNGGSRASTLVSGEIYGRQGCAVLMLTLRAHGDSDGDTNDIGFSARHDVVAAVDFLEKRRPGHPIIVDGGSLGAAAAVFAAKELGPRVRAYVLESAYRDLRTATRNRARSMLPPVVDEIFYLGLLVVSPLFLDNLDAISPLAAIDTIPSTTPILMLAGSKDDRARPDETRELFARVSSHARLAFFDGAGHESLSRFDPNHFREETARLLRELSAAR